MEKFLVTNKIQQIVFLNQMAGSLFRELAEAVTELFHGRTILYTGYPNTLPVTKGRLEIQSAHKYSRESKLSRLWSWVVYTLQAMAIVARLRRNTLFVISSNPPLLSPAIWLLGHVFCLRYVVLLYDLHPDVLVSFGYLSVKNPIVWLWRLINRNVLESSQAVVTIGPFMARRIECTFRPERTKLGRTLILPPWANTEKIRPLQRQANPFATEIGLQNEKVVLYSGNLGISHDIDSLLEAARLLRHRLDIRFVIIGDGEKWQDANEFRKRHGLQNLHILPLQPEERLPFTLALGDISVVSLDQGGEGLMLPSKTFYYFAAGSSIIGICRDDNDLQDVIKKNDTGVTVPPRCPTRLCKTIEDLVAEPNRLEHFKRNARKAAESKYSTATGPKPFLDALIELEFLELTEAKENY